MGGGCPACEGAATPVHRPASCPGEYQEVSDQYEAERQVEHHPAGERAAAGDGAQGTPGTQEQRRCGAAWPPAPARGHRSARVARSLPQGVPLHPLRARQPTRGTGPPHGRGARLSVPVSGVLYAAGLDPRRGTEPGKVRPVLVVQTDLLNTAGHPSTVVLPCTTRLTGESLLRVVLPKGIAGNRVECEVMVDQA